MEEIIKLLTQYFPYILVFVLSFIIVVLINFLKWIIENCLYRWQLGKTIKITEKLEKYCYPFLTIIGAVPLAFLHKIDNRFYVNFLIYIACNFLNYKIFYKIIINKIIEKIQGI